MSAVIEHEGNGTPEIIHINETGHSVSLKDYQAIYNQVTGRTEQIRKRYNDLLLVDFSEIKQLHIKITQLCDVHQVVAQNLTLSVFHEQERKEQFTSFERFETYNSNTTKPTVSLLLKYNFSIVPAGVKKAQEYTISIRLTSRITLSHQMEEESPPFMRSHLIKFITEPIAEITIDYVDYVIARGFVESFEEWVRGCKSTPKSKYLEVAQEHSHLIPRVLKIIGVIFISYLAFIELPNYTNDNFKIENLAKFFVIFMTGSIVISNLFSYLGSRFERAIDGYPLLSYINLNKGDERMIDAFNNERKSVIKSFIWYSVLNIALAIVATRLDKLI